jgi:hypothetical protein
MAAVSGEAFALPNRKAFADYIARIYLKYRSTDKKDDDEGVDVCLNRSSAANRELLPYQKLVRDYLMLESPYRGLLVYHGLGSGKTCSSIGVAESLLHNKKIFVMLPASLQENFRQELRTCGNPIYMNNNFWETRIISSRADKGPALAMQIPDDFLRKQGRYFVVCVGGYSEREREEAEECAVQGCCIEPVERFHVDCELGEAERPCCGACSAMDSERDLCVYSRRLGRWVGQCCVEIRVESPGNARVVSSVCQLECTRASL